jgi:hypothetical protein
MEANEVNAITPLASVIGVCIASLRQNAPYFGGRVAGAAEYQRGLRDYSTSMALPAAYVLPLGFDAEPNRGMGGSLWQIVHKHIGVAVELDAQRDRRGQEPAMLLEMIEAQINASVLNLFVPTCRMATGIYAVGAHQLDLDRARFWWQWEFAADWQITDLDGVQPQSIPLQSVEVDLFNAPGAIGVPGTDPAAVVVVNTGDNPIPPTDGPWPQPAMED